MDKNLIGWLTPNGIFHDCEFTKHYETADELTKLYYGETRFYPEEFLYAKGFAKITKDSVYMLEIEGKDFTFTNKQIGFLNKCQLNHNQMRDVKSIMEKSAQTKECTGDENLKYYEKPIAKHTMCEYPTPTKFIKINTKIPVEDKFRPTIGNVYPVIKEKYGGGRYTHLYFILINGEEVGIYPRECELVNVKAE